MMTPLPVMTKMVYRGLKLVIVLLISAGALGLTDGHDGQAKGPAVLAKCAVCHRPDERGRLSRIAFQRKTPEGWQQTVRRMVRLHGLSISVDEAKAVIKYLSDHQGLAPAEVRPIVYDLERRDIIERIPDEAVRSACVRCHSFARIAAQRRTAEEWRKLKTFHLALFPTLVYQMRQIDWPTVADRAITYLAEHYPFNTKAWRRWSKKTEIAGRWMIVGHHPGRGDFFGDVDIRSLGNDHFETRQRIVFVDGQRIERTGRAIVYAGFAWRGSSRAPDGPKIKEVLHLSEDGQMLVGRWFQAAHDQIGADVTLYRKTRQPLVLGLSVRSLRAPASRQRVTIYGANFPSTLTSDEIDFGPGVIVHRIENRRSDELSIILDVRADAPDGQRRVRVGEALSHAHLAIYHRIDYITVVPSLGLARLGGIKMPKQHQQFEALAFTNGPDGLPRTSDDVALGPVSAKWSLAEDTTDPNDDDVKFVGTIDPSGLFTPATDGPNPARRKSNNNTGQVWVVATYTPEGAEPPLTARAKLIVTVPRFIEWEIR